MLRGRKHPRQGQRRLCLQRHKNARLSLVFENIELGASIEDIVEWHHLNREQIVAVLEFAARSLDAPVSNRSLMVTAQVGIPSRDAYGRTSAT